MVENTEVCQKLERKVTIQKRVIIGMSIFIVTMISMFVFMGIQIQYSLDNLWGTVKNQQEFLYGNIVDTMMNKKIKDGELICVKDKVRWADLEEMRIDNK